MEYSSSVGKILSIVALRFCACVIILSLILFKLLYSFCRITISSLALSIYFIASSSFNLSSNKLCSFNSFIALLNDFKPITLKSFCIPLFVLFLIIYPDNLFNKFIHWSNKYW